LFEKFENVKRVKSESGNYRRTDKTMDTRTNNGRSNTTSKTKDWATGPQVYRKWMLLLLH